MLIIYSEKYISDIKQQMGSFSVCVQQNLQNVGVILDPSLSLDNHASQLMINMLFPVKEIC